MVIKKRNLVVSLHSGHRGQRVLSQGQHFERRAVLAQVLIDVFEGVDVVARKEEAAEVRVPEVPVRVPQRVVALRENFSIRSQCYDRQKRQF
jgi:hypothetical protein